MKILYLCNKHYVDTKMSRVRFHGMEELGKLVYVKWWGIGYQDYDNNKTVQQNIDTLEYKFDLVIAYKPLEMKQFKEVNIPKCLRYNEMFDINFTRDEILKSGANLVICHHQNEMEYYQQMENITFKHIAHCANHHIFRKMDMDKEIDFLLIGSIWDRYPLRIRMLKIFEKIKSQYKTEVYQHPGYDLADAKSDQHQKHFAEAINRAKIAITCSGKYRSRYGKLVEAPMCGTALACDLPDEEQQDFKQILINIDNSMSDDEIIEVLKRYLLDENLRKQKEKIGLEWSRNYTQEHYAKRLLKNIYDFLGKDINLDFNIQSLWIGDKLSNMEILSMKSFLHNNHNYHLYTYGKIENIPEGVIVKDGNDILAEKEIFRYQNGSVSAFSNLFRYKMVFEKGGYWVDTDLVCLKPFDFTDEYIFGSEPWDSYKIMKLNPCILKAPRLSLPMLNGYKFCLERKQDVLDGKIQWDLGPSSLLNIVSKLKLEQYLKDWRVFNLFEVTDWHAAIMSISKMKDFFTKNKIQAAIPYYNDLENLPKNNYAVHFYNEVWRSSGALDKSYIYDDGCLYEKLKEKYGVKNNKNTKKVSLDLFLENNGLNFKISYI